MNKMLPNMLAILIAGSALSAHAAPTYICQINGKASYSSEKINSSCRLSEMNGISEELADSRQLLNKPAAESGKQPTTDTAAKAAEIANATAAAPSATTASSTITESREPATNPLPAQTTESFPAAEAPAEPSWQLFGKSDYFDVIPDPAGKTKVVPTLAQTSNPPQTTENTNNTAAAKPSAPAAADTQAGKSDDQNGSDTITKIWEKDQFGSYDDIKIMPRTEASDKPASLDVKLRNQPRKTTTVRTPINNRRAPVITPPPQPAKPQLSRKQILQREIANEQAALIRAQAQLAKAKKAGGNTRALEQTVRDRQANVRAIQGELSRSR